MAECKNAGHVHLDVPVERERALGHRGEPQYKSGPWGARNEKLEVGSLSKVEIRAGAG